MTDVAFIHYPLVIKTKEKIHKKAGKQYASLDWSAKLAVMCDRRGGSRRG
jgi:hypothetical protein